MERGEEKIRRKQKEKQTDKEEDEVGEAACQNGRRMKDPRKFPLLKKERKKKKVPGLSSPRNNNEYNNHNAV